MSVFKCKMCGATLNISENDRIVQCEYCFTQQTIPTSKNERITNLFNRANALRLNKDFDKSAGIYESIVAECPEEAEAYWGLCLCKYGIEYVDDAKTGRKLPTCHRTLTTPIVNDPDFQQVYKYADENARQMYTQEAGIIAQIQKEILAIAATATPYDIFICYKETDDLTGERTEDSIIAQDIYTELIQEGYKVFFSRISLRNVAGSKYEPYIFSALSTAKLMLVIGTDDQYFNAVWVKNEWSRYLKMMNTDAGKHLIPCYKNINPYQMPGEFSNLQALDMGLPTFYKNLIGNITRYITKNQQNKQESFSSYGYENSYSRTGDFEKQYQNGKQIMMNSPTLAIGHFSNIPNYKDSNALMQACKSYQQFEEQLNEINNRIHAEESNLVTARNEINQNPVTKKKYRRALIIFAIIILIGACINASSPADDGTSILIIGMIYGAVERIRLFKKSPLVTVLLFFSLGILICFPLTAINSMIKLKKSTLNAQQTINLATTNLNTNQARRTDIQNSMNSIKAMAYR